MKNSQVFPGPNQVDHQKLFMDYFRFHRLEADVLKVTLEAMDPQERILFIANASGHLALFTYITSVTKERVIRFAELLTADEWNRVAKAAPKVAKKLVNNGWSHK